MPIPYGRHSINQTDIDAVVRVLRGDWLTTGPSVTEFEVAIADWASTPGAVAVSNGTSALHAAYRAANLNPGDEVITTPMTFVATAATAIAEGATVVFADVQPDTGNIDPDSVASLITPRTKVIAGVDYAGHPIEINELSKLAHDNGALLLEDGAHSIGSTYRGRPVGHDADLTTFSFFPTKNLTTGEGGAVVSPNLALLDRARKFRMHGLVRDKNLQRHPDEGDWHQEVHELGLNYRLPDILAALGTSQLSRLEAFKEKRRKIFEKYSEGLSDLDQLVLPARREYVDPVWHLYPVRVLGGERKRVFDYMRAHGVIVQVNYLPVYWHPAFQDLGYKRGLAPNAESYYEGEISLPMYFDLSEEDQETVISVLRGALSKG
jgi:UDP-4-amino-4,6-dideoxy-N-acetyl-beta-L-altrosamine transaminase